jgi:hypothetical protein
MLYSFFHQIILKSWMKKELLLAQVNDIILLNIFQEI